MDVHESRELRDSYRFPGFTPSRYVETHPRDVKGWVVELSRRKKGESARAAVDMAHGTTIVWSWFGTWTAAVSTSTSAFV